MAALGIALQCCRTAQLSRAIALSCQRRSTRCESSDSSDEDHDAGERQQQQRREHARNVEPIAGLDDAIGEARARAGRAGRDLGHHRADQRQPAGDAQPAEDVGQRRRQLQIPQHLPARGAVEPEQVGEIVVDRVEPERGVGEHREERDDPGAGQHRAPAAADRSAAAARSRRSASPAGSPHRDRASTRSAATG